MSADGFEPSSLDAELQSTDDVSKNPLDSIPSLTYEVADEQEDLIAGLKLVADSVAQQRQTASRILIFHPLNMAVYIGAMAFLLQYFYKTLSDLPLFFTTAAGITMVFLVTIRWFTGGYLFFAEEINWDWLGDDQILISKFGEEIIGAAVLRWEKGEGRGNKKKKGRGVVRAWTVGLRFRGKGVGTGLLEEVVKNVEKRGGDEVVFAEEHANSKRILYSMYNGVFDSKERRARQALQDVIENTPNLGGRKK